MGIGYWVFVAAEKDVNEGGEEKEGEGRGEPVEGREGDKGGEDDSSDKGDGEGEEGHGKWLIVNG